MPEPVPAEAIQAAAAAIHRQICDPHAGHEYDDVDGYPHAPLCLTCSGDDGEPPYARYFRREPDDDDDLAVATAALAAAAPAIAAAERERCEAIIRDEAARQRDLSIKSHDVRAGEQWLHAGEALDHAADLIGDPQ